MTPTRTGWIIFIAAIGMMIGLSALDVAKIKTWSEVGSPAFIAEQMGHFSVVIAAFVAGKIIPTDNGKV